MNGFGAGMSLESSPTKFREVDRIPVGSFKKGAPSPLALVVNFDNRSPPRLRMAFLLASALAVADILGQVFLSFLDFEFWYSRQRC